MQKTMTYSIKIEDLLHMEENCNIFWTDKDNRVLGCNDTQYALMKDFLSIKSRTALTGKRINDILPSQMSDIFMHENNKVMQTGRAHQFLNIAKFKNYKTMIYLTIKTPLYDDNHHVAGVFGISHHLSVNSYDTDTNEPLTKRESECLALLIKGKTASEIASELNLSKRTVEYYVANIKHKLGCCTRSALVNKVHQIGLSALMLRTSASSVNFKPGDFIPGTFHTLKKIGHT